MPKFRATIWLEKEYKDRLLSKRRVVEENTIDQLTFIELVCHNYDDYISDNYSISFGPISRKEETDKASHA